MVQELIDSGIKLYRHNAWADSPDGLDNFNLNQYTGALFVGYIINSSPGEDNNPTNYTWIESNYSAIEPEDIAEIEEISEVESNDNTVDDDVDTDDYLYDNAILGSGSSGDDENSPESGTIGVSLISGKFHNGYANQYIRSGNVVHIDVVIDAAGDVPPGQNIATGQLLFLPAPALNTRCVCYYGDNPVVTLLRPDGSFVVRNCGRDNMHAGNDIAISPVYITDGTMLMGEATIEPVMLADVADDDVEINDVNNTPSGIDYDNIRKLQAEVME